jgi:hypothetical protein
MKDRGKEKEKEKEKEKNSYRLKERKNRIKRNK